VTLVVAGLILWAGGAYGGTPGTVAAMVVVLLSPYWLGPVAVRLTNKQLVPEFETLSPEEFTALPAELTSFFYEAESALEPLGFEAVAWLREPRLTPGFTAWAVLFFNRKSRDRALALGMAPGPNAAVKAPRPSLAFGTRFGDGRFVETSNADNVNPFPRVPKQDSMNLPEVQDPAELCRLHARRVGRAGDKQLPPPGQEVKQLQDSVRESYQKQVRTGYLWWDAGSRTFRPTFKGALLMTWKLLPPMNALARRRRARENQAFLARSRGPAGGA
jgi:hypothetical protein